MDKRFVGILAAITIGFIGFVFVSNQKSEAPSSSSSSAKTKTSSHILGNTSSKVVLVEYGDYQCPYCQQYNPTVKQVVEANKEKIKFQFMHFPLISLHQNAFAASRAAEAAGMQGKFWEMHEALYAPTAYFEQYAKQISLDIAKFKTDFASETVNNVINADLETGNKLGITGTPSFFINGKKSDIANDPAAFQKAIDAELAKQSKKTE
jgi:protein-disulfide isomerase